MAVHLCVGVYARLVPSNARSRIPHIQSRFSLLRLSPTTGRKHQLRVHCADVLKGESPRPFRTRTALIAPLAAPVVGDFKLAPNAPHADALNELMIPLDQVLLHSTSLSFYVRPSVPCARTEYRRVPPLPGLVEGDGSAIHHHGYCASISRVPAFLQVVRAQDSRGDAGMRRREERT